MAKKRVTIPKDIREKVLKEFNHRCAIGGEDRPQLHHIDEDPSNNDPLNLIPFCPNCHLSDQHDPTRSIEPGILKLLRIYRDPTVLKPQFYPLYKRLKFLELRSDIGSAGEWAQQAKALTRFVAELEMGKFYSEEIGELVKDPLCVGYQLGAILIPFRKHNGRRSTTINSLLIETEFMN